MTTATAYDYRRPLFDPNDALFRHCLTGASIVAGALLVAMLLAPVRRNLITHVEQLSPRFARLILEPRLRPVKRSKSS